MKLAYVSSTVTCLILGVSNVTMATETTEKWAGSGAVYSVEGQKLASYEVEELTSHNGKGESQTLITIRTDDGKKEQLVYNFKEKGNTFEIDSTHGKGGGACYGADLCDAYVTDGSGEAFYTTVILDGAKSRRQITLHLKNGKTSRIYRENLKLIK